MMRTDREVAKPVDSWTAWPVYWGPVMLGAMAAVVATVLFGLIGTAVGAHKAGTEGRITTWRRVRRKRVRGDRSFFALVIGAGRRTRRVSAARNRHPHGAILVVAVSMRFVTPAVRRDFKAVHSLAPTPAVPAVPGQPVDPNVAIAARNGALAAAAALLMGLMGSVIGAWMASGEPMTVGNYRVRVEPLKSDRTTRI